MYSKLLGCALCMVCFVWCCVCCIGYMSGIGHVVFCLCYGVCDVFCVISCHLFCVLCYMSAVLCVVYVVCCERGMLVSVVVCPCRCTCVCTCGERLVLTAFSTHFWFGLVLSQGL